MFAAVEGLTADFAVMAFGSTTSTACCCHCWHYDHCCQNYHEYSRLPLIPPPHPPPSASAPASASLLLTTTTTTMNDYDYHYQLRLWLGLLLLQFAWVHNFGGFRVRITGHSA